MKYSTIDEIQETVQNLLKRDDDMISLYLPYGIVGQSEDKCRIARKNVCDDLMHDERVEKSDRWLKRLAQLQEEVNQRVSQEQRTTRCIFLSSEDEIDFWLPSLVSPMFAVGKPAVEPLADYASSHNDVSLLVFDFNDTHLLRGQERTADRIDWKIPGYLKEYYGEPEIWSLDKVRTLRDKYNARVDLDHTRARGPLSSHQGGGEIGYSSRQFSVKDKEIYYFARIIGELVGETVPGKEEPIYLAVSEQHEELVRHALEALNLSDLSIRVDDVKSGAAFSQVQERLGKKELERWSEQVGRVGPAEVVRGPEEVKEYGQRGRLGDVFLKRRIWDTEAGERDITRVTRLDREDFHEPLLACLATGAKLHCMPGLAAFGDTDLLGVKR